MVCIYIRVCDTLLCKGRIGLNNILRAHVLGLGDLDILLVTLLPVIPLSHKGNLLDRPS